ncbi:MAG: YciI-like protein [Gemmatimonadaceae bacterium]
MHYLLFYEGADNYAEVRAPFRPAHLQHAREAQERGELVQAGAFMHPTDGSVLLFRGDASDVAERFARTDPFVREGVVKRWYVREWNTIVGPDATVPTLGV